MDYGTDAYADKDIRENLFKGIPDLIFGIYNSVKPGWRNGINIYTVCIFSMIVPPITAIINPKIT
jgi:hypothetical protein